MEGVSEFIVGTCQLYPKWFSDVFDFKQFPIAFPPHVTQQHFLCGSAAEFYIEPMNSCIDDVDTMVSFVDELAFPDDVPVLPHDIRGYLDAIKCYQIMPYPDNHGFVQLRHIGNMMYNWNCKHFEFQQTNDSEYLVAKIELGSRPTSAIDHIREHCVVGPALKCKLDSDAFSDTVLCLWCPRWPKQAKHWPCRRRNCGWPTSDNIQRIVQNGCHVVFAKHPACRDDKLQWRLSFSEAELCLLRSLTPVQQIVYHMVRFFAKRELIRKDCLKEDEVLCTYHFKTLMLWSCEGMSREFWNSLSVIQICCNLLQKLSEWLQKRYCPNYFIPQANLFYERMNQKIADETIRRLNKFCHSNILSDWFAKKYIKPVLERVFAFKDTVETVTDLGYYMLRMCEIRDRPTGKPKSFDCEFSAGFLYCAMHTFRHVMVKRTYNFREYINFIACSRNRSISMKSDGRGSFQCTIEFSLRFPQFGKVLFILHAATELGFKKITHESKIFTEFIREISWQPKVVRSKHHDFPMPSKARLDRSGVLFLNAQDLMENLTGMNSLQEFKLVSRLSKEFLGTAINCDDLKSSAIRNAAFVYLAALHFLESDYKTAIDLCSTVFISQVPGEEEMTKEAQRETLNAGCLFCIDDVVIIIGFYLLFRRIQDNSPFNRRRYLVDLRLTPEVFAHHLIILSNERRHKAIWLNYNLQKPTFPLDEILMAITNLKSSGISKNSESVLRVYQRNDPSNKTKAPNKRSVPSEDTIIQLLVEYSLENLTSFYDAICEDFNIQCSAVDCYRAAYLYKCRNYPELLHLCEKILNQPDLQRNLKEFTFANVMVVPPLDTYFDTNIQCLLGFQTLVHYLSSLNEDSRKIRLNTKWTFQHFFDQFIWTEKRLLSVALLCDMKFFYFLGRHFLARYLKVRCLIDCYHSFSEVMFEFEKLKSNLPFEHIIYAFLLKTLDNLERSLIVVDLKDT